MKTTFIKNHSQPLMVLFFVLFPFCVSSQIDVMGTWTMQADMYRGQNGKRFTISFPAGGTISNRLWGTDFYTDDSSIATAAVHAGLITPQSGGTVTIELQPGAQRYNGCSRNGVTSLDYGPFGGSFIFVMGMGAGSGQPMSAGSAQPVNAIQGDWGTQADTYRGQNGKRITINFPAGSISNRLWGTDFYTDDSSIATAAVHAGLITPQSGGTVTIEIRQGADGYKGSTRNGVSSGDWGGFAGSFIFVTNRPTISSPSIPVNAIQGDWGTQAVTYRGQNGKRITLNFPAGSISNRLWGTDFYTDDSSIATAAVHAGLITPQSGGTVTIEIRQGADGYKGSTRNGVSSGDWGGFAGSFVIIGR